MIRADLLLRLGRGESAAELLQGMAPSARAAELLERGGRYVEALQCYLDLGLMEEASKLASRAPNRDRLVAQIYLRTGRQAEAGDLLAQLGLPREAAEAYEAAQDWGRAAYRWEAAQEPRRAAEAYEKAGRPIDAARCFEAAGVPRKAAKTFSAPVAERPAGPRIPTTSTRRTASRRVKTAAPSAARGTVAVPVRGNQTLEAARARLAAGDTAGAAALLMNLRPQEPGFAEGAVLVAPLLLAEGFCEDA